MAEIVMPRLSDTMEEGTILRWLVRDGELVRRGEELVEIETDKATMTYESDLDGVLETVAAEGDTLPVGTVIARVSDAAAAQGTATTSAAGAEPAAGGSEDTSTSEPLRARARARNEASDDVAAPASAPSAEPATAQAQPAAAEASDNERVKASPLARRIARERGVDLSAVTGSGPGGRVVKADVQAAGAAEPDLPPASGVAPTPQAVTTAKGETTEVELSRTQQTIARRMAESKATIPHFSLQADIDMEACVGLRSELKRLTAESPTAAPDHTPDEAIPTYNDMVVKAAALALREHPRAGASYRDGRLQLHARVNVGVAVAVDSDGPSGGALIVPTVFDADVKSLGEIARETRALASRVRDGSITPPELGGGTFTVSNLGMFGVTSFTAIINPPQAAILSVGALAPRAVVSESGEIIARHTLTLTLACDHRVLYGADAARFLARIRELLQAPAALTL